MITRAEIEKIALALPATEKVIQWGDHDVFKVGGKVFGISGDESLSFKVTDVGFLVLTESGVARQAPYLAKGQWVIVDFDDVEPQDVEGWLANSHALISAKLTKKARAELGLV
jgi:predicted DNA-binding protein (MmcQ/YjbR family)